MVSNITNWTIRILQLYLSDYLRSFHVREMARLLNTNHSKLLSHLNILKKQNILKSSASGRNKYYSLNLDNLSTKEYLLIAEKFRAIESLDNLFLIKKLYKEIASLNPGGCLLIFGSYAKGDYTKESDIDILYIGDEKEVAGKIKEFGKMYKKEFHILSLSPKALEEGIKNKDGLVMEVIKKHILFYNAEIFVNTLWRHYA